MNPIGSPFIQLTEVASSNNYAMAQVQAHLAEHGFTWFAHKQTAGKGQRGKSWFMEPKQNIILTTVIQPSPLLIHEGFYLSAAVSLACHDFFSTYASDETKIKWPNDLYWRDRKAGGILIENFLQGSDWRYAIVGIGININQTVFPSYIPNPVSLKQITGKTFDCITLAHQLCKHLESRWQQILQGDKEEVLNLYNKNLYKLNQQVSFKKENAVFTAQVKGVAQNGALQVNTGTETVLPFGEFQWLVEGVKQS